VTDELSMALRHLTPATVASVTSKGSPKEIVRLSEEARDRLVERAAREGVSKSDIMRRAIYKELGLPSPTA
jgi:hypothetical protein